jgi:hypothetical protein
MLRKSPLRMQACVIESTNDAKLFQPIGRSYDGEGNFRRREAPAHDTEIHPETEFRGSTLLGPRMRALDAGVIHGVMISQDERKCVFVDYGLSGLSHDRHLEDIEPVGLRLPKRERASRASDAEINPEQDHASLTPDCPIFAS